jgi:biopolymer transport protein ExbB/TolQ
MLHLEPFPAPPPGLVLFGLCVLAFFILGLFIIGRITRALRAWERRRLIEADMRQAARDADDQQRIARKILGEYR